MFSLVYVIKMTWLRHSSVQCSLKGAKEPAGGLNIIRFAQERSRKAEGASQKPASPEVGATTLTFTEVYICILDWLIQPEPNHPFFITFGAWTPPIFYLARHFILVTIAATRWSGIITRKGSRRCRKCAGGLSQLPSTKKKDFQCLIQNLFM